MIRLVISSKIALVVALKKVVLGGGGLGARDRDRAEWIDDKETRNLLQKIQKKKAGKVGGMGRSERWIFMQWSDCIRMGSQNGKPDVIVGFLTCGSWLEHP